MGGRKALDLGTLLGSDMKSICNLFVKYLTPEGTQLYFGTCSNVRLILIVTCVGQWHQPGHHMCYTDPVDILLVVIYAQGVFHLNTWKMKIVCSISCNHSKYCERNWS